MKNTINIINFIRGCEPRVSHDLKEAVQEQIKLSKKYNLPMTFLYQYDAMVKPDFVDLLKNEKDFELGVWFEFSRWIVEKVGLEWRGSDDWDWHSHVDLTMGYTVDERKLLLDEAMRFFKELFGYYPKTVGSWAIDAVSINYLYEKYDVDMVLICKEQWGTDGYSLWGGYYSEGYYPCKNNMLCPAQSQEEQIDVPVFRMLGSDPVDQYMNGIGTEWQNVNSMETVYSASGANKEWVEWFLSEVFDTSNIGLNYCQAGQENAFGWHAMKDGYKIQMELFDQARKNGSIDFEFAGETGRKFKEKYKTTPVSSTDAHKKNCSAVWYNSKYYRSSIFYNIGEIFIRDLTIFNEKYKERYLENITKDKSIFYDNLPVVDCFKWSDTENIGGLFFEKDGKKVVASGDFISDTLSDNSLKVRIPTQYGDIEVIYNEKSVSFIFPESGFSMNAELYNGKTSVVGFSNEKILCEYEGFKYEIEMTGAECTVGDNNFRISVLNKAFEMRF